MPTSDGEIGCRVWREGRDVYVLVALRYGHELQAVRASARYAMPDRRLFFAIANRIRTREGARPCLDWRRTHGPGVPVPAACGHVPSHHYMAGDVTPAGRPDAGARALETPPGKRETPDVLASPAANPSRVKS